jgi:uncharacterized RDD family membrane protein YckC
MRRADAIANGEAEMVYASWIKRAAAISVDWALVLVLVFVGMMVGSLLGPVVENAVAQIGGLSGIVGYGYSRWYRAGKTGQSWGREMFNIRMVDEFTGKPVGFGRALLRDITHILDLPFLVGFIRPLVNVRAQTWADELGRTVVVPAQSTPGKAERTLRPSLLP